MANVRNLEVNFDDLMSLLGYLQADRLTKFSQIERQLYDVKRSP
jgi:hypothetical protein